MQRLLLQKVQPRGQLRDTNKRDRLRDKNKNKRDIQGIKVRTIIGGKLWDKKKQGTRTRRTIEEKTCGTIKDQNHLGQLQNKNKREN